MKLLTTILTGVFMVAMAAGSAQAKDKETVAVIHTDKGDIVLKFLPDAAPKSAENFEKLAKSGFYNGLTFHRVEPNFVIQGGDPKGNGMGGPVEADLKKAYGTIPEWVKQDRMGGYTIPAEIKSPHVDGAVAMARLGDQVNPTKASSASQFYICLGAQHFLDGGYTVFGQVVEGMDVARKIQRGDKMLSVTIKER